MPRLKLQLRSDPAELPRLAEFLREVNESSGRHRLGHDQLDQLLLAAQEAANNIILHAYEGMIDRIIDVEAENSSFGVAVWLRDEGKNFDPEQVSPTEFDGSQTSGYGLTIIQQSVDNFRYQTGDDGRNCTELIKVFRPAGISAELLQIDLVEAIAVVTIRLDRLDTASIPKFKESLDSVIENHRRILIDLNCVEFVDSSGIGALVGSLRRIHESNGELMLCNLRNQVRMLIEMVRLNNVFTIASTRQEAIDKFRADDGSTETDSSDDAAPASAEAASPE